jgi:hypothetical protein
VLSARLGALPADGAAPGDVVVILTHAALDHGLAVAIAVVAGICLLWLWTVLWHAGVVRWQQWGTSPRPRLAEILGLGLIAFWPFARLALTAIVATAACMAAVWFPATLAIDGAHRAMADHRVVPLAVAAVLVTVAVSLVLWAVTLRAAWLLSLPAGHSAVLAWLRALSSTLRSPLSSVGVVLVWAVPALGLGALPLLVGPGLPEVLAPALSQASALLRAFCWVAMFCSFATATGLWPPDEEAQPGTPDGAA